MRPSPSSQPFHKVPAVLSVIERIPVYYIYHGCGSGSVSKVGLDPDLSSVADRYKFYVFMNCNSLVDPNTLHMDPDPRIRIQFGSGSTTLVYNRCGF